MHIKLFHFNNFNDLKREAYVAAKEGIKTDFNKQWESKYISDFPDAYEDHYRKVMSAYEDFLLGKKSQAQAKEVIDAVHKKYAEDIETDKKVHLFMKARNEAFKKAGIKYGRVTFTCPICNGEAHASRYYTPENLAHKVSISGGCKNCLKFLN